MSITKIRIENYKSIKKTVLTLNDINVLVGENGSGKSNVISAIMYFYNNLSYLFNDDEIFDANNKYSNCTKISITYDLKKLQIRCKHQNKNSTSSYLPFFNKILSMGENSKITITLTKIKGKKIQWTGADSSDRILISNLFPFYFIDSRTIDLTDWSKLWEHIGDLVKVDNDTLTMLKNSVKQVMNSGEYKLEKTFMNLKKALKNANVEVDKFTPKQYAQILTQSHFEGNQFVFREKKLQHFSNGTNAFNYTKLLIEILLLISQKKMKIPFLIIDEPEISLHNSLIDELTDYITSTEDNLRFLIATHSPRLIKNTMMNDFENSVVYHIKLIDKYTYISKMKLFDIENDAKSKIVITDQHANVYFSNILLAIEGETELELFRNKYLRELFPILKKTDIVNNAMSNDIIKKIISPKDRCYKTPIIQLFDMDKMIINDNAVNSKFQKRFINISRIYRENYFYGEKRLKTVLKRKRIDSMSKKLKFDVNLPFYSSTDEAYKEFILLIKKYLEQYNIIVAETTCEGMLINNSNFEEFWLFLEQNNECINKGNSKANFDEIEYYYNMYSNNDKLNFLRLIFEGKSDYLKKTTDFKTTTNTTPNSNTNKDVFAVIGNNTVKKTSGWVSKWLEKFFFKRLDINDKREQNLKRFKLAIEEKSILDELKNEFKQNFSEIHDVISFLEEAQK
ncbi:MAG: AAA family ATPase [Acetobacterium woodii]|nr:AAA family ATPase [Acetobacterium woodii]